MYRHAMEEQETMSYHEYDLTKMDTDTLSIIVNATEDIDLKKRIIAELRVRRARAITKFSDLHLEIMLSHGYMPFDDATSPAAFFEDGGLVSECDLEAEVAAWYAASESPEDLADRLRPEDFIDPE